MSEVSERRRKPRQKSGRAAEPVWVMLLNVPGSDAEVRAKVVDSATWAWAWRRTASWSPSSLLTVDGPIASHEWL